jgi:hypothetical protein
MANDRLVSMGFDPNDERFVRLLANRYTELNLVQQKKLSDIFNTPENQDIAARHPISSLLSAVDELDLDAQVREIASKQSADPKQPSGPTPSRWPGNNLKLSQIRDIMHAALKDTERETRENEESCRQLNTFIRSVMSPP